MTLGGIMKPTEVLKRERMVIQVLEQDFPLKTEDINNIIFDHGSWLRRQVSICADVCAVANALFQRFSGGSDE